MQLSTVRRLVAAAGIATALVAAGPTATARADHDSAVQLCSQAYAGTYTHYTRIPIYTGDVIGGWISLNYRVTSGNFVQWCAVTLRKNHGSSSYTMIRIARTGDSEYRTDAGDFSRYAGPVVRGADWDTPGMCVFGRGRIGNWVQDFQLCNGVVEV